MTFSKNAILPKLKNATLTIKRKRVYAVNVQPESFIHHVVLKLGNFQQ